MKNLLLGVLILGLIPNAFAQEYCVKVSLIQEGQAIMLDDNAAIHLVQSTKDTISADVINKVACFSQLPQQSEVDVVLVYENKNLLCPLVPSGFLKLELEQETYWQFGIDKKPFNKKEHWLIKDWKGIYKVEYLELESSNSGNATRLAFKIKKDGTYIN